MLAGDRMTNVVLDLPALTQRIGEMLSSPIPKQVQEVHDIPQSFVQYVRVLIEAHVAQRAIEQLKGLIRVDGNGGNSTARCLRHITGAATDTDITPVGSGSYGTLYLLPPAEGSGSLTKSRVAKVIDLSNASPWTVDAWKREVAWGTLAGSHGIGPRIHDTFVCSTPKASVSVRGIIVMDYIDNAVTLARWRQIASKDAVRKADAMVKDKIDRLHALGLTHGDLHAENVMVVAHEPLQDTESSTSRLKDSKIKTAKDVYIVDYGYARDLRSLQEQDYEIVRSLVEERTATEGVLGFERLQRTAEAITRALVAEGHVRVSYTKVRS
jgi:hypothetical protein